MWGAFYDPGVGSGEVRRFTLKRLRSILSAGVGTGIDENVIDCYSVIRPLADLQASVGQPSKNAPR